MARNAYDKEYNRILADKKTKEREARIARGWRPKKEKAWDGLCKGKCDAPATHGKMCFEHWILRKANSAIYRFKGSRIPSILDKDKLIMLFKEVVAASNDRCIFCNRELKVYRQGSYEESYTLSRIDLTQGFVEGNIAAMCKGCAGKNNRLSTWGGDAGFRMKYDQASMPWLK
jgi:hypothetical protein